MPNAGYRPQGPEPQVSRLTTFNGAKTALQVVAVPDEGVFRFEVEIFASRLAGINGADGDCAIYNRVARVKNLHGQVSVYSVHTPVTSEDPHVGWKVYVEPWSANVQVSVQGASGVQVAWTAVSRLHVQL